MSETPYQKRDRILKKRSEEQMSRIKRAADEVFKVVINQTDPYRYNRELFEQKKKKCK